MESTTNFAYSTISNFTTSSGSTQISLIEEPYYIHAMNIIKYAFPFIIFTGTVGNFLSFVIMIQREIRQTSTFFYLATLAVADTIVLYISAFKTWIKVISGFELLHQSPFGCKTLIFTTQFCVHFSAWLIVAVTIERFLAVWFPLRATTMCSLSRAKFVTFMIAMIFILVNSHVFWTAELVQGQSSQLACVSYAYQNTVCKVFPIIYLVLYSALPVTILLIFNTLIIISLIKNKPLFNAMTKTDQQMRHDHRKLAICLLVISFTWIVTTVPRPLYPFFLTSRPKNHHEYAEVIFIRTVCFMLMYINHAINFFIYGITGQRFRMELKRFLCKCRFRQSKPKPRLTFKSSGSGSGSAQETSLPLMGTPQLEMVTFA